jgi:peroxiredoxin
MVSRSKPLALALVVAAAVPAAGQTGRATAGCAPDAQAANLNFTVQDLDGTDVTLSAYRGKVILLDFWATWCGPCKVEIPGFIDLFSRYRSQGLQVLGFAVDDPVAALKAYANELGMNYPVLVGRGRDDVLEAFGPMVGLPTTVIIGRDGRICARHTGFTPKDRFEREIRSLLSNLL